jgi:hypothetical protein
MCGLGLPPSKILVAIFNYLGCELIHLHLNTIAALNYFSMLCECWLDISPYTSLFWYFYSLTHSEPKLFYGLGLTLRRNRQDEDLKATFRGCWKGSPRRWFHVDLVDAPQEEASRDDAPPQGSCEPCDCAPQGRSRGAPLCQRVHSLMDSSARPEGETDL